MTKDRMRKIDKEVEPLVDAILPLLDVIKHKLPIIGGTLYARSPTRSLRAVLKHLEESTILMEDLERSFFQPQSTQHNHKTNL